MGGDADDLTDDLAGWVVAIEIGEPRGRRQDTTWTDPSGTTWRAYP